VADMERAGARARARARPSIDSLCKQFLGY